MMKGHEETSTLPSIIEKNHFIRNIHEHYYFEAEKF